MLFYIVVVVEMKKKVDNDMIVEVVVDVDKMIVVVD
jgi:hypothetical protein